MSSLKKRGCPNIYGVRIFRDAITKEGAGVSFFFVFFFLGGGGGTIFPGAGLLKQ